MFPNVLKLLLRGREGPEDFKVRVVCDQNSQLHKALSLKEDNTATFVNKSFYNNKQTGVSIVSSHSIVISAISIMMCKNGHPT